MTQTSTYRTVPDVAYNASSNSLFAVYDSYSYGGWVQVYGTSAGARNGPRSSPLRIKAALSKVWDRWMALHKHCLRSISFHRVIFTTLPAATTALIRLDLATIW